MTTQKDHDLARHFTALSHPRRAMIFRLLAASPESGRSFLRLQAATRLCESSLVHHLREMERCGLIYRRRKGSCVAYLLSPTGLAAALHDTLAISAQVQSPARRAA